MLITIEPNFYCCIHLPAHLNWLLLDWPKAGAELIYVVHIFAGNLGKYIHTPIYKLTAGSRPLSAEMMFNAEMAEGR